jgi:hypothetical protein
MATLTDVLTAPLKIHGETRTLYGVHEDLARFLDQEVKPEHVTLETGAGRSTLVFLRKGVRRHIAIQPDPVEFAGIREYCQRNDIRTDALEAVVARSQDYLATAHLPELDVVLIDGDHSFPTPFMDWYYTAEKLRVDGLMAIDDTDILTGTFLADFMTADPKWDEVLRHPSGRFAVYRKLRHPIHDDHWGFQPLLMDHYPTSSIRYVKNVTPGRLERGIAAWLPAPIREMLRLRRE